MWLTGLGHAFNCNASARIPADDVYWLIPGDFLYNTAHGRDVLKKLCELPTVVLESDCELCLGEIKVGPNESKELIDI